MRRRGNGPYDNAGNPTTFRGGGPFGFNLDNQFTGAAWSFDGKGGATNNGGVAASYDAEGRLSTYGSGFGFSWRPDGLRGRRTLAGYLDLYFLYDGAVPILELYAGAGGAGGTVASRSQNTFGPLGLISRISNNTGTTSADNAFYAFDERGDTAQRTNLAGNYTASTLVEAYGKARFNNGRGEPFDGFLARFGYWRSTTAGLFTAGFRVYDPNHGRWLTRDPIGYAGGINLYSYMNGNPVMGADPLGLDKRLIVYGDDGGVEGYRWVYELSKPFLRWFSDDMELIKPDKSNFINNLIDADEFYFWGHGSPKGGLWINKDERFEQSDIAYVQSERKKRGKSKLKWVDIHACDSLAKAQYVNNWLTVSLEIGGYAGLTAKPNHINPQLWYRQPISADPTTYLLEAKNRRGKN